MTKDGDDVSGQQSARLPAVSVVMPVLEEERHLRAAVQRVLAQKYPGDLEIVLAVGPSKDRTQEVADALAAEDSRVRIVPNRSGRTPDALNAGISAARYQIIARVDGHAELCDGYLATAVTELPDLTRLLTVRESILAADDLRATRVAEITGA